MSLSGWPSYYLFVTKVQIVMADLSSGFSVEASNHRIPPPVKTKVAACDDYDTCLAAFKKYF